MLSGVALSSRYDPYPFYVCGIRAGTERVTITASLSGGAKGTASVSLVNPVATLRLIWPSTASAGQYGLILTVADEGFGYTFVKDSRVYWNGLPRSTTLRTESVCPGPCAQWLDATILPEDLAAPGTATITVVNPPPGGGTSNALTFTIDSNYVRGRVVRVDPRKPHRVPLGQP